MEPLSALSLFCNVIDICKHTIKVYEGCREICKSAKGLRAQDEELLKYLLDLQEILNSMRSSSSKLNRDDLCRSVAGPLNRMEAKVSAVKNIVDGFRAQKPGKLRSVFTAVVRIIQDRDPLDRALQELKQCQTDIHFAIAQSTRLAPFFLSRHWQFWHPVSV